MNARCSLYLHLVEGCTNLVVVNQSCRNSGLADAAHAVRCGTRRPMPFDACLGRSERGTAGAVYRKQGFLEFREVLLSN